MTDAQAKQHTFGSPAFKAVRKALARRWIEFAAFDGWIVEHVKVVPVFGENIGPLRVFVRLKKNGLTMVLWMDSDSDLLHRI